MSSHWKFFSSLLNPARMSRSFFWEDKKFLSTCRPHIRGQEKSCVLDADRSPLRFILLRRFFSQTVLFNFFAPISLPQFSSPFSSDEEIFSLLYDLSGSGPTRLHHYTSSPLEQVVPPLEVAPLPVWQPVEVLPGHPEDHVELGVRQVLLQVAAVHVARKAVVGSEQQVQRVDVGGLFSDTFFKSFVGNE